MSVQFITTGVFIVVVIVALIQNETIRSKALVPDKDPLIHLGVKWQLSGATLETWRTELLKSPAIRVVSASENPPWSDAFTLIEFRTRENAPFESIANDIGYDYDKAVGFKVLAGRPFDRIFADVEKRSATSNTAIIDLSLSRRMGYATPNAAIGKLLSHTGRDAVTIIGVIEDNPLRIQTFMDSVGNVYFPGVRGRSLPIIQIDRTRIAEGLAHIDSVWKTFVPTEPVQRYLADEVFQWSYFYYSLLGTVLTICGGIALTVSLLGASGFALFAGQQRAHEIGVRKTLGASAKHILTMLLKDLSKPILIANVLAWPLAFIAVQKYLSLYLERIELTLLPFVASLVISIIVVWLAIGKQVYRAARMNPASVLRHE
jgi:putative ABC transport system permease protein